MKPTTHFRKRNFEKVCLDEKHLKILIGKEPYKFGSRTEEREYFLFLKSIFYSNKTKKWRHSFFYDFIDHLRWKYNLKIDKKKLLSNSYLTIDKFYRRSEDYSAVWFLIDLFERTGQRKALFKPRRQLKLKDNTNFKSFLYDMREIAEKHLDAPHQRVIELIHENIHNNVNCGTVKTYYHDV